MPASRQVSFVLNGRPVVVAVKPGRRLLHVLREDLGLTGTKQGCDCEGECGACTILLDGEAVRSCLLPAEKVAGRRVVTVEGLAGPGRLHPLQQAFIDHGAVQCGFCTPGMLLSAAVLLVQEPIPSREQIMLAPEGNLCPCTPCGLMSMGAALMEEYLPGVTRGLSDYYLPTIRCVPDIEVLAVEVPSRWGPLGAKGLGEAATLPTALAIVNAIHHATGARLRELPATPERVLAAIRTGVARTRRQRTGTPSCIAATRAKKEVS